MQHTKVWNGSFHVNHASCLMLAAMWKIHWCSLLHTTVCLWIFLWPVGMGLSGLWGLWFCGSKLNMFAFDLTHAVRASNFLKPFVSLMVLGVLRFLYGNGTLASWAVF